MKYRTLIFTAMIVVISVVSSFAMGVRPPGPPEDGYGSDEAYICSGYSTSTFGSITDGTYTYIFVPDTLINGSSAPVLIHLHGAMLLGPEIYWSTLKHVLNQGYIVIHPQFNKGLTGLLSDTDQNEMIARAIAGVNEALNRLGSKAETDHLYIYGHSLGGLMGMCWEGAGGPAIAGRVLAHPNTDPETGGGFQPDITMLDYAALAPAAEGPVTILGGNQDTIAPLWQQIDACAALGGAGPKKVWYMHGDWYGSDNLDADHMAPINDDGIIPALVMDMFGGDGEVDALDYRFYHGAVDAMLRDQLVDVPWDMGKWSDGTPVNTPVDETP